MRINGQKFESRNEKVIPIIRPDSNVYFIAEALDDLQPINDALDKLQSKVKTVTSMKPGEKSFKKVENAINLLTDGVRFQRWQDGVVIHSLKYVTQDEKKITPLEEPEGGWDEMVPEELRVNVEIIRVKYPVEWETVDFTNPETWGNWRQEMLDSKINRAEINRIINGCMEANSLSEAAVQGAMDDFLASPPVEVESVSTLPGERGSSPSGEVAQDSE